jgi:hypothetical protein
MALEVDWESPIDEWELCPEGDHDFEIDECEEIIGKSGWPCFNLRLRAIKNTAWSVKDYISHSPKARGIYIRKLRAMGLEGKKIVDESDFSGIKIRAAVYHYIGNDGKTYAGIDINAKGSECGYYSIETGFSDLESDLPF